MSPVWPALPMPQPDWFKIKIKGKTAHGADPKNGVDAAVAGSAVVMALQTMVSREFDPADPVVVTVGSIHSGSRFNIIRANATLRALAECTHRSSTRI